jgi:hypothetical protein
MKQVDNINSEIKRQGGTLKEGTYWDKESKALIIIGHPTLLDVFNGIEELDNNELQT